MKKIKLSGILFSVFLLFVLFASYSSSAEYNVSDQVPTLSSLAKQEVSTVQAIQQNLPPEWPTNGILVFPDQARKPWLDAIGRAKKSIKLAAYKLSDPQVVDKLLEAKRKNIDIQVLIQPVAFAHDQSANVASPIDTLKGQGINIYTLSDRFNQAHYKMILIDGEWGMVSSGNLDEESFDGIKEKGVAACRDFAITVTNPSMVAELGRMFQADISDTRVWSVHSQLVWGPDTQRSVFLQMINSAKESIRIYQQDFQDEGLAQAVAGAARAGVKVEIIMMPFPFSKTEDKNTPNQELIRQAGGTINLHKTHYIHAKLMIIDNKVMYIGSCNFYPSSLDKTRELGVLTSDQDQIKAINSVFDKDCS